MLVTITRTADSGSHSVGNVGGVRYTVEGSVAALHRSVSRAAVVTAAIQSWAETQDKTAIPAPAGTRGIRVSTGVVPVDTFDRRVWAAEAAARVASAANDRRPCNHGGTVTNMSRRRSAAYWAADGRLRAAAAKAAAAATVEAAAAAAAEAAAAYAATWRLICASGEGD